MKPHIFQQGPVLHAIDGARPIPIRALDMSRHAELFADDIAPTALPQSSRNFAAFPESPAKTLLELKSEMTANPLIMYEPSGGRFVCPIGASKTMWIHNSERDGRLLSSQLLAMLASGKRPYFGRNHEPGGEASGYPIDIYWRPQTGIAAIVDWTAQAEQEIVSGEYNAFSSEVIYNGSEKMGLSLRCGTLVHRTQESAFGKHFCRVSPVTKLQAMNTLADEFLRRVDARRCELSAAGNSEALTQAADEMAARFPKLHAAHSLRQHIRREVSADALLKFA